MAAVVSLRAVVDEIEFQLNETRGFLNKQTGELYSGTNDDLARAENGDDEELLDWEVELVEKLREILGSSDWIELPTPDTHEEYRLMERFCWECCEGRLRDELMAAITGRGAFRRFKDGIRQFKVEEAWYTFHRKAIEEETAAWLESQGIEYVP
jgi:hypothetical protein